MIIGGGGGGARRDDFSAPVVDANIMPMKND